MASTIILQWDTARIRAAVGTASENSPSVQKVVAFDLSSGGDTDEVMTMADTIAAGLKEQKVGKGDAVVVVDRTTAELRVLSVPLLFLMTNCRISFAFGQIENLPRSARDGSSTSSHCPRLRTVKGGYWQVPFHRRSPPKFEGLVIPRDSISKGDPAAFCLRGVCSQKPECFRRTAFSLRCSTRPI